MLLKFGVFDNVVAVGGALLAWLLALLLLLLLELLLELEFNVTPNCDLIDDAKEVKFQRPFELGGSFAEEVVVGAVLSCCCDCCCCDCCCCCCLFALLSLLTTADSSTRSGFGFVILDCELDFGANIS